MQENKKVKNIIYLGIIFLMIYLIGLTCVFCVFSDKLSIEELKAVDNIYTEMRAVNPDIKSDFYVKNVIKIVDKQYVLEELRKDSLLYSIYVNEQMMNMLLDGWQISQVKAYVFRCDLDFEIFNNLEPATKLFDVYRDFVNTYNADLEFLNLLSEEMTEIVYAEEFNLREIRNDRILVGLLIVSSYIFIVFIANTNVVRRIKGKVKKSK